MKQQCFSPSDVIAGYVTYFDSAEDFLPKTNTISHLASTYLLTGKDDFLGAAKQGTDSCTNICASATSLKIRSTTITESKCWATTRQS